MGSVKLVINDKVWPYTRLTITSPATQQIGAFQASVKCPRRNFSDLLGPIKLYRDGELLFKGWVQEINPTLTDITVDLDGDSIDYLLTSTYTSSEHKYYKKRVDEIVKDLMNAYLPDINLDEVEQHEHEYLQLNVASETQLLDALYGLSLLEQSYFYIKPGEDQDKLIFRRRRIKDLETFEKHYDGSGEIIYSYQRIRVDSKGSGDFWNYSDGGSALLIKFDGIKEVVCQVLGGTDRYRRMLMLRGGLEANSRFLTILFDGNTSHLTLAWRKADGAKAEWLGENTGSPWDGETPFYLKFEYADGKWKAYWSKDKVNWNFIGEKDASDFEGDFNYIGLCATGHDCGYTDYFYRIWINDHSYMIIEGEVTLSKLTLREGVNILEYTFTKTMREYANYIRVTGFVSQPGDHDSWTESLDGWQIYDGSNWVNASDGGATLSSERVAGSYSLKFPASAQKMRYPSSLDLGLDGSIYSGFDCFFGNESGEDIMVTIKLYEDENNYFLISQPVRRIGEAETVNWTQIRFIAPNITIVRKCETDPFDSSNLLDDPSFETWPTNWTLTGDITQHNITRTGSYSVKTTSLGSISQVLENIPEVIWVGCWRAGASEKNEDYLTIKVEWLNENDEVVDTAEYTAGGPFPSSWQKVGPVAFERPATAVKAKIIYTLYSSDGNDKYIDDAFAYTFPNINWIEISKDKNQPLYVDNLHLCNWRTVIAKNDEEISKYGKREYREEKNPAGTYEDLQSYANDLLTEKTSLDYEITVTSYIPSNVWIWHGDVVHVIIPSLGIDQKYFVEQVEYDFVQNRMTLTLVKLLTRLSMLFLR